MLLLPGYQTEDFRAAIDRALDLHGESNAGLALVADPAAGAYYGLELRGDAPCFPLLDSCADVSTKSIGCASTRGLRGRLDNK